MEGEPIFRELDLFLQDEKNLVELYDRAADEESFTEIRARLRAHAADCQRHLQLLHNAVELLGGRPQTHPAEQEASERVKDSLSHLAQVDGGLGRLHRLEALLAAERRCHANWDLLHRLADQTANRSLQELVHQVEPDKLVHLGYLEDLYHDLALRVLAPSLLHALQATPVVRA